jgi:hypothetical protein
MSGKGFEQMDVATLYHCVFFAYQKAVHEILGSGSVIFVSPVLDTIRKIGARTGVNLTESKNIDEALENLSRAFEGSGFVRKYRFEKLSPNKFVLHVDGCLWAKHIHQMLEPKDVICPQALVAMAIFEKIVGKIKPTTSEYYEEGTKTIIQTL